MHSQCPQLPSAATNWKHRTRTLRTVLDRLSILLIVPPLIVNLYLWNADRRSPYSNYWATTDSLGPLLWLDGSISISADTVWGQLVQATTLPSLKFMSWMLHIIGASPYDFQDAIVITNVVLSLILPVLIGLRLFRCVFAGVVCTHYASLLLASFPLGYMWGFRYGEYSIYRPLTGLLSIHLGLLALAFYLIKWRWLSVIVTAAITPFHPATGGILAIFILLMIAVEQYPSLNTKAIVQALIVLGPVALMFAWERISKVNSIPNDYPWEAWWMISVNNVMLHVAPWRYSNAITGAIVSYVLILSVLTYLYRRGFLHELRLEAVVIAAALAFLVLSIVLSEGIHDYYLTGFYLHKATVFAPLIIAIVIVVVLSRQLVLDKDVPFVYLSVLAFLIPPGHHYWVLFETRPNDFEVFRISIYIYRVLFALLAGGWILAAFRAHLKFRSVWLLGIGACFVCIAYNGPVLVGAAGAAMAIYSCFRAIPRPAAIGLIVVVAAFQTLHANMSRYSEFLALARAGFRATYSIPGDADLDKRADVFRWIRFHAGPEDIVLDPPVSPQERMPIIGYNELLSHHEHLLTAKEAHIAVYVRPALYTIMRDFKDVYDLATPAQMFTGNMQDAYRRIDTERLAALMSKHPRLKYFVREKDLGAPVTYPTVYENQNFAVHCLRCGG